MFVELFDRVLPTLLALIVVEDIVNRVSIASPRSVISWGPLHRKVALIVDIVLLDAHVALVVDFWSH